MARLDFRLRLEFPKGLCVIPTFLCATKHRRRRVAKAQELEVAGCSEEAGTWRGALRAARIGQQRR